MDNFGIIWLTRVKEVPANTGFLLMGEADTYEIPVKAGGLSSYYQNMFKGTLEATTIYTTDGNYTNYYLSNGESGVGFYKVTKEEGVTLGKIVPICLFLPRFLLLVLQVVPRRSR